MKKSNSGFVEKFFSGSGSDKKFKFMAVLENLIFLGVILLVNYLFFPKDMGFLNSGLHPFWIIIILIPMRYGLAEGLVSSVLTGGCYFLFSALQLGDYSLTYPLLFILTAGILGQNRDVLDRKYNRVEDRLKIMSGRLDASKQNEEAYRETLSHFENSIAAQFSGAMDMFRELSVSKEMSSEQMKEYLLEIVKKFFNADKCAYFEMRDNTCYKIYDGENIEQTIAAYPIEEDLILLEAFRTGNFSYLHLTTEQDLDQNENYKCLIAGCLHNNEGEVMGLVGIESLPFSAFNAQSLKLFSSLMEFWSGAINDKIILEKTWEKNIIDEKYQIYKYNYFTNRIEQEFERAKEFAIPLSITLFQIMELSNIPEEKQNEITSLFINNIKKYTTELDMICHYSKPGMFALIQPFHLYTDAEKKVKDIITETDSYKLSPYKEKDKPLALIYAGNDFQVGMESCRDLVDSIEKELNKQITS